MATSRKSFTMITPNDQEAIASHIQDVVIDLGYDIADENFKGTPQRVAKFLLDYAMVTDEAGDELCQPLFPSGGKYNQLILQKNITVTSMCAHHMLPFTGVAHVGYIPSKDGKVLGLSKLARIAERYSRQLTLQEKVTEQIADCLERNLAPRGVMVVIDSHHQCMGIRGVKQPNASTVTSSVRGVFAKNNTGARAEFLALLGR